MSNGTIYLIEDDLIARRAAEFVIESAGYQIRSFGDAAAFLKDVPVDARGCALIDIGLPGMEGTELREEMTRRGYSMPAVFLTATNDVPTAVRAMRSGAIDVLTKPTEHEPLLAALARALRQDEVNAEARRTTTLLGDLSPRERQVLDLLIRGMSNKQVGFELGISQRTVEVHRARVMEKMRADSLAQLAHQMALLPVIIRPEAVAA
jgi:two-component system, LuxR family, response regulator FixJ